MAIPLLAPPMAGLFAPVISWIFRDVVIKFLVLGAVFALITVLLPIVSDMVLPFVGVSSLSSLFSALPPQVWFFLDLFTVSTGVPLVLSAYMSRFLIRRIPFVG